MSKTAIDPVCKMNVDIMSPPATAEFEGETFYFCMVGCKNQFIENPRKFLSSASNSPTGWKKLWRKK